MIIVGVDGSEDSIHALHWALAEARLRGLGVAAVQAWHLPAASSPGPFGGLASAVASMEAATARSLADTTADVAADGAGIELRVRQGSAAAVLLEESTDEELLVVGSRGLGGFGRLLLGSVSHQCATHGRSPVAVIPGPTRTDEGPRAISVGVDGSKGSCTALGWAIDWARPGTDVVTAVHAWHVSYQPRPDLCMEGADPADRRRAIADAEALLDHAVSDASIQEASRARGVELRRELVEGESRWALVEHGKTIDLLVAGSTGHSGVPRLLLGSTTNYVVHHAPCPVVVSPRS